MNCIITNTRENDYDEIVKVWETSVRKTHNFLNENDINFFRPLVKEALAGIESLLVIKDNKQIIAFIGIEHKKIEMLFIRPDYMAKGLGKQLVTHGIENYNIKYVDVNEQNSNAVQFYLHMGFSTFSRSETDPSGKPFPILHMELKK